MYLFEKVIKLILVTGSRVSALAVIWLSLLPQFTLAMTYGTPILGPTTGELELMRQNTVKLVTRTNEGFDTFCSGVVISPLEVYSEAHCFGESQKQALNEGRIFVQFSPTVPFAKPISLQVRKVQVRLDLNYDVALLRLSKQGPYSTSIPFAPGACDPTAEVYSIGYGVDESGENSEEVKFNIFTKVSDDDRRALVASIDEDLPSFTLFKKSGFGSACLGDSGGPVLCRSQGRLSLAGTTSAIVPSVRVPDEINNIVLVCQSAPYLFMSPISRDLPIIEGWRAENLNEN